MGGRGSASGRAGGGGSAASRNSYESTMNKSVLPKKQKSSATSATAYKSVKQAPDYIREQTGLNITKFRNSASQQFERRGEITIDISDMSQGDRTKLANALRQKYSPYTGEQSGTWLFTIKKKKVAK